MFAQTPVDKTLVRVVDLGPFKHTVDDGLETRKAAFECLATLLDAFRVAANAKAADAEETGDFLDAAPPGFANGVATAASLGAGDHYDVKIVAHALICALVKSRLGLEAARGVLPETCAAFKATLTAKLKSDAVKQEHGPRRGSGAFVPARGGGAARETRRGTRGAPSRIRGVR